MALVYKDRVKETTAVVSTGTAILLGAPVGYRTFGSQMANNDTCYYSIVDTTTNEWEIGLGTYISSNLLARNTILSSSNSNNVISFGTGVKDVFITLPSSAISDLTTNISTKAPASAIYATDYATLALADAAAVAANKQLIITTQWNTVPSNFTANVEIKQGGKLNNSSTCTFSGSFSAGLYQVFIGSGVIAGLKESRPEWFGAKGDGTNDDTTAFVKAIAAARVVKVTTPANFYNVIAPIKLPSLTSLRGEWNRTAFVGSVHQSKPGIRKTTNTTVAITPNAGGAVVNIDCIFYTDPVTVIDGGNGFYTQKIEIKDLNIQGAASSLVEHAIYVDQGGLLTFKNLDITDVKHAFYGVSVWSSTFTNVHAQARIYSQNGTSLKFDSCSSGGSEQGFDGFSFDNVLYSTMINCTGDNNHESTYTFKTCYGWNLIGCGSEAADSLGAYIGTAFNFLGGSQMTIQGAAIVTMAGTKPKISVMSGDALSFKDLGAFPGAGTGPDLYVGNDASGSGIASWTSFNNTHFTGFSYWAPTLAFASGTNTGTVTTSYGATSVKVYTAATPAGRKFGNDFGTWTPIITFGGTSTGITYSVQEGTYSINSNTATISGRITLTSKGTATGEATITGLPFIIGTSYAAGTIGYQANLTKKAHVWIQQNDPNIWLVDDSANAQIFTDANVLGNATFDFTIIAQMPAAWGAY